MKDLLIFLCLPICLWSCGNDDEDLTPVAPKDSILRPSGELKPWDLSAVVPIDSIRALAPGTPLYLRTEFANGQLADLEMLFVQVIDDFLPPMPIIMVESSDPVLIQLGGIAQGMSGSPVFSEKGTLGAIAYAFNAQDNPPYYSFATPIEWVIGSRGTVPVAKPVATWDGGSVTPLEIPLVSTGANGLQPVDGGGLFPLGEALSAGLTLDRQESFEAGRPLVVGLLLGETTSAALGTISYIAGNRVYGFGHPLASLGSTKLPIIEGKVLGEISNIFAPFKFATLNPTVQGTLTEDHLPAVRGVLGEEPELVPIQSKYTFASGSELELTHRMPTFGLVPDLTASLLMTAVFNPLTNRIENEPHHSVQVTANISFSGTDSVLARTRLYAEPEGRLFSLVGAASGDLSFALSELMTRNDYAVQVREAEVHMEIIPEPRFAQVVEVTADTVAGLGSTLPLSVSLRVGRRIDREIGLELAIPDTVPPGLYELEVASAANLGNEDGGFLGDDLVFLVNRQDGEETLEEAFARLNQPDENIILKARLRFSASPYLLDGGGVTDAGVTPPPGSLGDPGPTDFPDDTAVTVSTEKEIGLHIEGTRSLQIQLTDEE